MFVDRYEDYPVTDVLQMTGRANRPMIDQEGKIPLTLENYYKFAHKLSMPYSWLNTNCVPFFGFNLDFLK